MTVGIIGLGLIGGSLAKAYRRDPSVTVLGWDTDRSITEFAQIAQAIHAPLTEERLGELDTGFEKFPELYREYGKALRDNKWMDYDDQMVYAKKILELHEDVRTHFQNRFPYICVDESQDTSRIQHVIIRLLAGKSGNIFMVGDEDQSIYGFRASGSDGTGILLPLHLRLPGSPCSHRIPVYSKPYRSCNTLWFPLPDLPHRPSTRFPTKTDTGSPR